MLIQLDLSGYITQVKHVTLSSISSKPPSRHTYSIELTLYIQDAFHSKGSAALYCRRAG